MRPRRVQVRVPLVMRCEQTGYSLTRKRPAQLSCMRGHCLTPWLRLECVSAPVIQISSSACAGPINTRPHPRNCINRPLFTFHRRPSAPVGTDPNRNQIQRAGPLRSTREDHQDDARAGAAVRDLLAAAADFRSGDIPVPRPAPGGLLVTCVQHICAHLLRVPLAQRGAQLYEPTDLLFHERQVPMRFA